MEKWLEIRGEDDCPYLFISKYDGNARKLGLSAPNYWCKEIISDIIGRRVNPHLIRGTRSTHILESGLDIKKAQALLGHKQSSTTDQFYDLRQNKDDLSDIF
jgi:site-specific recombinase XerD